MAVALGPLWTRTFRDPVREGRLRLDGIPPATRHLARAGLLAIVLLLGSTMLAAVWRRGDMLPVDVGANLAFVPPGVFAMSLVGFWLANVLLTWGALAGSAIVRLAVAAGYLLICADFGVGDSLDIGSKLWILNHAHQMLLAGYVAPPAALVVAAVTARWPRVDRWVVLVARVVCVLGAAALFLGLLWIHVGQIDAQQPTLMPSMVGSSVFNLHLLLLPLLYVAAVAVIDFALDVSTSVAEPAGRITRRWIALLLVLALALVKLWFEVGSKLDYWRATVTSQPQAVLRTIGCVGLLVAVVVVVTRFRRSEDTLSAKEDLVFAGAFVLALPFLLKLVALSIAIVVAIQSDNHSVATFATRFPDIWLDTWGLMIASAVAVVAGVLLMRRSEGGLGDELGSGMIVVGAWSTVSLTLTNFDLGLGFSHATVGVAVTVGVLAVLAVRWRQADVPFLVTLGTVLGFTWLVTSRGDYLTFIGGLVGLSSVVVLVFGIVWTLLSGSSFASGSSRPLPRGSRQLLFLGYLLLSVVVVHWDEVTHAFTGSDADGLVGYYFLGIPIAAWLLGRHVVRRDTGSAGGEPGALPEEVGDGVGTAEL